MFCDGQEEAAMEDEEKNAEKRWRRGSGSRSGKKLEEEGSVDEVRDTQQ